MLTIQH